MGASIWMVFLFPIILVVSFLGNLFTEITGKTQAEIALPYDESKGIVWEYDNKDDCCIDFVETRIDGSEQIFVFKDNDFQFEENMPGCLMDLVFTDKNGNKKTYYADYANFGELVFYEESECLITEYTAVVHNPYKNMHWVSSGKRDRVLIQPVNYDTEVTFTVVCMPDDIEKLKAEENYAFNISFSYINENGAYTEAVTVVYKLTDGQLEIEDELWTIVHQPKD